jgi:hypothetical protein
LLSFHHSDRDFLRDVNQSFGNIFYQLFHAPRLLQATW